MPANDVEFINESLEVLEEQLAQPTPRKSVVNSLLMGVKAIAGTTEFGAAVVALVQFVQSII